MRADPNTGAACIYFIRRNMTTIFVVVCDQAYANYWSIKAVFDNQAAAHNFVENSPVAPDLEIEEWVLNTSERLN